MTHLQGWLETLGLQRTLSMQNKQKLRQQNYETEKNQIKK